MDEVCILPTKRDLCKTLSSYNCARNDVYTTRMRRIVVTCTICHVHFKNENSHCRLNEAKNETVPFETMAENMNN